MASREPVGSQPLNIRVLLGDASCTVTIPASATVADLIQTLRNDHFARETAGKTIRLIHSGRILSSVNNTLASCNVVDGTTLHCAVSASPATTAPVNAHRVVPSAPPVDGVPVQGTGPRGFDRLRLLGLEDDEITALRTHFFDQVYAIEHEVPRLPGEDEPDRRIRIEEEWMQRQGPHSEFALNVRPLAVVASLRNMERQHAGTNGAFAPRDGTDDPFANLPLLRGRFDQRAGSDDEADYPQPSSNSFAEYALGCFMGFFLGFLVFIWFCGNSLSRAQKRGIIMGIMCNILLTLMRQTPVDSETSGVRTCWQGSAQLYQ